MNKIMGEPKTLREVLSGEKYSIDFYQREYQWEEQHILTLMDDLIEEFLLNYDPIHERNKIENYSHYFLGSIIISQKMNKKYIIDG